MKWTSFATGGQTRWNQPYLALQVLMESPYWHFHKLASDDRLELAILWNNEAVN
jgi:hypothetical protein